MVIQENRLLTGAINAAIIKIQIIRIVKFTVRLNGSFLIALKIVGKPMKPAFRFMAMDRNVRMLITHAMNYVTIWRKILSHDEI